MLDNLIDILNPILKDYFSFVPLYSVHSIAKALTQQGILVPPCKVGDVIYAVDYVPGCNPDRKITLCKVTEVLWKEGGLFVKAQSSLRHNDREFISSRFGHDVFTSEEAAKQHIINHEAFV